MKGEVSLEGKIGFPEMCACGVSFDAEIVTFRAADPSDPFDSSRGGFIGEHFVLFFHLWTNRIP